MTLGAATVLAAARMGPLALVAAPFGRAWLARAIVGALLIAAVLPFVVAQPAASLLALPTEIVVGLWLGLVAALPFAAAQAAGALVDLGTHARRPRGPLAEAYFLFALALFAVADGPRLVATAAGASYLAWPIGRAPSTMQLYAAGAQLVAVAVTVAAPALAAMLVAELALALIGRVQPALGRSVEAAPLRALTVLLVAAAAVYAAARALAPLMSGAARLVP
jgi:type III secretory pathway component EscT